ncbi:unnamed protein product [Ixodes hexagonus]
MICVALSGFVVIMVLLGIIAYFTGKTKPPKPATKAPLVMCFYDPTLSSLNSFVLADFCAKCCTHLVFDGFEVAANKIIVPRQAPSPTSNVNPPNDVLSWTPTINASGLRLLIGLRSRHFGDLVQDITSFNAVLEDVRLKYGSHTGLTIYWQDEATLDPNHQRVFYTVRADK